ncbi:hypothetical protein SprV_0100091700 [Sparganum proliferum]
MKFSTSLPSACPWISLAMRVICATCISSFAAARSVKAEKGRLVGLSLMVHAGFAQPLLFIKQLADSSVIAVQPVLVPTSCASVVIQGSRVNSVPQLTPPSLRGDLIVWGWQFFQVLR